ncbi:hypothetical protein NLG97_g2285 [Lecanicillium saksenae]|uniref:Uncharacterized protein n=1 Tax=Lecanicillium saksenae TaxID=468837 RepID=A0ACC1R2S2_9HYPO|nr:hypothetical protein NLG97_g2285 [Lecanicillium saksenae]
MEVPMLHTNRGFSESTTRADGAGVHTELTKNGTIRRKRWATRARTGCLTCRSRHIRCDEGKPYSSSDVTGASPTVSLETEEATLRGSAEEAIVQSPLFVEPEPPHWEQMEAVRYFRDYIIPLRKQQLIPSERHRPQWSGPNGCYLVMRAASHRIATASRALGIFPGARDEPSMRGVWATVTRHITQLIVSVNIDLRSMTRSPHDKQELFRKIFYLIYFDVAVNPSSLCQHLRGYLALVQHVGGVSALMAQNDRGLDTIQEVMLMVGNSTNTTSPANKLLQGFAAYTDKDLAKLAGMASEQKFTVPTALFISCIRLTQLRGRVADGTITDFALKLATRDLLNNISTFDAGEWGCNMKAIAGSRASSFARIFQVSTRLYGILSLPSSAIVSWSTASVCPQLPHLGAYQSVRVINRQTLLELLYQYRGAFARDIHLTWPLVVAGVSLAGDGSVEDRNFIAESLLAIWSNPLARRSPLLCLEKLRIFWASGKTAWDDCFDEPTPCNA